MGGLVLVIFYGSILFVSLLLLQKLFGMPLPLTPPMGDIRGSSVYELMDWWDKPTVSFMEKLKSVASDVFLLKGYYQRDKGSGFFSISFMSGFICSFYGISGSSPAL